MFLIADYVINVGVRVKKDNKLLELTLETGANNHLDFRGAVSFYKAFCVLVEANLFI